MKRIILILTINIYGATDSVALRENIVNIVGNSKSLLELNNNIKNLVLTGDKQLISALYNNGLEIIFSYLQNNFKDKFSVAVDPEVLGGIKELTDKQELIKQNLNYGYLINASKDSNSEFYNKYLKPFIFLINYFNLKYLKQLLTCNHINTIPMVLPIEFPLDYINIDFINWLNNNFNNQIPDIDSRNNEGNTALMHASFKGYADIVKLLTNAKADINIKGENGDTALICASYYEYKDIVELLLNANADINIPNNDGYTALTWASCRGHKDIVKLLISHGANLNTQDNRGNTALIWASRFGYIEIVELLINANADINIKNNDERTARIYASKHGYKEIIKLLINKGKES